MKVVARRTGLSPHVIRMWEKRYGVVAPARTETRRRLYTEADITRLGLLRQATLLGYSISRIAALPTEQLRALVNEEAATAPPVPPRLPSPPDPVPAQSSLRGLPGRRATDSMPWRWRRRSCARVSCSAIPPFLRPSSSL